MAQLLQLDVLMVDEAGMMSAELLQALDHYLSVARRKAAQGQLREKGSGREANELEVGRGANAMEFGWSGPGAGSRM
jgi:hypothetical protein